MKIEINLPHSPLFVKTIEPVKNDKDAWWRQKTTFDDCVVYAKKLEKIYEENK